MIIALPIAALLIGLAGGYLRGRIVGERVRKVTDHELYEHGRYVGKFEKVAGEPDTIPDPVTSPDKT